MRGRKAAARPIDTSDRLDKTPSVPAWMPAEAKAVWRQLAPVLTARGVLTIESLGTLEAYALAVGALRRAHRAIAADGDYQRSEGGKVTRHAGFSTVAQMGAEARRLAAELGLTPTSRGKITDSKASDDQWDSMAL